MVESLECRVEPNGGRLYVPFRLVHKSTTIRVKPDRALYQDQINWVPMLRDLGQGMVVKRGKGARLFRYSDAPTMFAPSS